MFLTELFEDVAMQGGRHNHIVLDGLTGVPSKALPILTRLARFHQVRDLSFDQRLKQWIAAESEGVGPFMLDAKRITSAAGKGVATNNESVNEAILSAAEAKRNPRVEIGNQVCIKAPDSPHAIRYAKLIRWGRSGLAIVVANDGEKFSVPPSWVFASEDDAWPAPKWSERKAKQSSLPS